jgi:para-nitrobenzyl esterase
VPPTATPVLPTATPVLPQASALDVVQTDAGLVAPARDSTADVRIFKMIPYAAPPVSDLRWKPPQPVAPWQGVRRADFYSPVCMGSTPWGTASMFYIGHQGMSEDCLYLNVWTPAKAGTEKLPVLVIVTDATVGGTYQVGEPTALAKKGIVGVTLNYRNGVFGWLIHPELDKESGSNNASGNYHYLDLIAALKWVQKNIAAFGGDPTNVTLWSSTAATKRIRPTRPSTSRRAGLIV